MLSIANPAIAWHLFKVMNSDAFLTELNCRSDNLMFLTSVSSLCAIGYLKAHVYISKSRSLKINYSMVINNFPTLAKRVPRDHKAKNNESDF